MWSNHQPKLCVISSNYLSKTRWLHSHMAIHKDKFEFHITFCIKLLTFKLFTLPYMFWIRFISSIQELNTSLCPNVSLFLFFFFFLSILSSFGVTKNILWITFDICPYHGYVIMAWNQPWITYLHSHFNVDEHKEIVEKQLTNAQEISLSWVMIEYSYVIQAPIDLQKPQT
jgi:hypothetical protein